MILHYGGKYDGNENSLPHKDHHPNAVPFREADDMKNDFNKARDFDRQEEKKDAGT